MVPRGKASFNASDQPGEKQYPSRPLTYKRSVEDHFFGSSRSLRATPTSTLKSKSSAPTITRILNSISHSPSLEHVDRPSQTENKAPASKATFRWMKGDLIGKGSHGRVYLGLNANTGEIMAVKQVELQETPSDRLKDSMKKVVDALMDERETLKDLDHPNIVQYLGFEDNRETLNIFLQYVSGGTIGSCLRHYGIFREETTKYFASQILEGLAYLHAQGIIHRDLKSENILVEETGVCKISDFGISKKLAELDSRAFSLMKGTSYWMAPEVVSPEKQGYDAKIDIWSVGCILFEMWTGKRPWYNEAWLAVWTKLMSDKSPPPLPEGFRLSPEAEDFRSLCFHSDPRGRPSASLLLMHRYLELPNRWIFPGMENMGLRIVIDPSARNTGDSGSTSPSPEDTEVPEVAQLTLRTTDINFNSQQRPPSPAKSMRSEVLPAPLRAIRPLRLEDRPKSPPLVIIEPLAPRKHRLTRSTDWMARERSTSLASESSGSQRSSQSESRATRRLVIHNPDSEERERPKSRQETLQPTPFFYVPPPLPEIGREQVPYSTNLAPLPQTRFVDPVLNGNSPGHGHSHSNSKSSGQYQSNFLNVPSQSYATRVGWNQPPPDRTSSPKPIRSDDRFSDSDSDYSTSTWQKPPTDIANSPKYISKVAKAVVQQQSRASRSVANHARNHSRKSSVLGGARPAVTEVLGDLETFFPGHDLDEPVNASAIESTYAPNVVDGRHSKRYTMKSVKAIAEEQIGSPVRQRQTRLWDTHTEEIKAHR